MTIRHSAILIRGEGKGIQIAILEWLLDRNKNDEDKSKLLAICDFEAYSNGLNFVYYLEKPILMEKYQQFICQG